MTAENSMTNGEVINSPLVRSTEIPEHVAAADEQETVQNAAASASVNALKTAVIVAEVTPANEALRYGTLAFALTHTSNPYIAAAALGVSTLAVEGGAALASAQYIADDRVGRLVDTLDQKLANRPFLQKWLSPKRLFDKKLRVSPVVEAGMALSLGTVAVLEAKHREDPTRTAQWHRRHGMLVASSMAGVFAVEGALLAEGVENYTSPSSVGAALLSIAGIAAFVKWGNKRAKAEAAQQETSMEVVTGVELSDEQCNETRDFYEEHRREQDGPVLLGLYGEDLNAAMKDPDTIMLKYNAESVKSVHAPVLVPVKELEWYNLSFLQEQYGDDKPMYCYTHPPLIDEEAKETVMDTIKAVMDEGAVVVWDEYKESPLSLGDDWAKEEGPEGEYRLRYGDQLYEIDRLGGEEDEKKSDMFVGEIKFNDLDAETVQSARSLYETYQDAIASGEIVSDSQNGSCVEVELSDEDADRVWKIYEKPFERLSKGNPVLAGFDEHGLKAMLKDPSITKLVSRQDGVITTVAVSAQDFEKYPWFNTDYFKRNYPEYFKTGNIFLFPGIVTDENIKSRALSMPLLNLATTLAARRGTNALVSFECTELSTRYIPRLTALAVRRSGVGEVTGLEAPVATMEYKAMRKIEG